MNTVDGMMRVLPLGAAVQWDSPRMLGVAFLVAALGVAAVVLLYVRQVKSLPGKWKILLPGLRCLAVLALAASLARPVAMRTLDEDEQGAVVVVIDHSHSMSARDTQRTPAMLVALADGMGRLPPGVRARAEVFAAVAPDIDRLPTLVSEITQAQVELDVAQLQGKENPGARKRFDESSGELARVAKALAAARPKLRAKAPRLAEALAILDRLPPVSGKQWGQQVGKAIAEIADRAAQFQTESDDALYKADAQVRAACNELAQMNRLELAEQAVVHPETGLLARLPGKAPLYGYAIGPDVAVLPLRGNGKNVSRLLVAPDGVRSDLTGGLREVLEQLRYLNVQAVVLFSDGRQTGAEAAVSSSLVGGTGAAVFTVSPAPGGPGAPVRDLAVEKVIIPQSVFVGETLTLTADVRWSGLPRGKVPEITVRVGDLEYAGRVDAKENQPGAGVLKFSIEMREPGPQRVTVNLVPVDGEITTDNNSATRYVKVLSDKFEVLLIGGAPTWDFRYLRNALSRTNWISPRSVLLDREGAKLDLTPEQLAAVDVVILCDAPANGLAAAQWEAVRKMVAQRGGSAILMAGRAHLPREFTTDVLAEFLPWKRQAQRGGAGPVWRVWPGEEPSFRIVPGSGTPLSEALTLDDSPAESAQRWMGLPPIFRYLSIPELKEIAEPVLVESNTGSPVLTRHRLGRGNVFFLGIDETWRWRYKTGERDQDRFFQQLIRAAADEPYAATHDAISLDADRVVIAPAESVKVRARLNEPPADQMYPDSIAVEVLRNDAMIKTQMIASVGGADSGRYEGAVGGLGVGDYQLRVKAPDGAEIEYPLHVAENLEAEMANLTPDEDLLKRLSASSGGDFRTLEQFRDLPGRLAALRARAPRTVEVRLWSSWYLYAFVVGCLGLEWAIRKRVGLS